MTEKELEDYMFTLDICKMCLPGNAHNSHITRLREIAAILKRLQK